MASTFVIFLPDAWVSCRLWLVVSLLCFAYVAERVVSFARFSERRSSGSGFRDFNNRPIITVFSLKNLEMGKKKSCQEVIVPRPLNATETRLYGWLFTRLRMRLPFSDFQRDVMSRCRVAVSQLHLNGWGFILAFEKVCLHFGFCPTIRLFFYIYDVHFPPGGYGYVSFRARQGQRLFDSYEDSIQEFKWHYFKMLAAPGKRFLVSLPSGLPKRNKCTCRFILDGSDAEDGKFLDDLLDVKMKRTKLDELMAKMADPKRMGPRPVLPTSGPSATAVAAAAAGADASSLAAAGSPRVESSSQALSGPLASEANKAKKQPAKRDRSKVVDLEEEPREDPTADLQSKRRKKKPRVDEAFEKALGDDSAWEHEVDPLKIAFPADFDYRKALNAGLTSAPVREALTKMPPEQLLGESYHLHAKSLACLQVGVETALVAKIKVEKELSAALDQIEVLKGERDSALSFLPFKEKATTLEDELSEKKLEHQSALDRIAQLEAEQKVLKAYFESSQLSLEAERKRAVAAEEQVMSLAASLKSCQADLSKATEASEYWRSEWYTLGSEVTEMCQETLDVCLDQVSHLCPGVDFSAISLKSRWDPKGRRIFVPQESEVDAEVPSGEEVVPE
ncbi:hypothetical protein PIB30_018181 [Stylosanthes scabra]|uniref:Transposase (Putative), gypsy type n=1 Tax=Stylosanthes scabra TaxID=79078 RepID=A0ABU6S851_9FABA|nr:hypothetical protein [Stylosanthes scabra]